MFLPSSTVHTSGITGNENSVGRASMKCVEPWQMCSIRGNAGMMLRFCERSEVYGYSSLRSGNNQASLPV